MTNKDKIVIIYLPNGGEAKYTTSKQVASADETYCVAEMIECEPTTVNIGLVQDGKVEGESYVGMPYLLQMF